MTLTADEKRHLPTHEDNQSVKLTPETLMKKATDQTRYGIYEWFGRDAVELDLPQRRQLLKSAAGKDTSSEACPFAESIITEAKCSKPGGVCSIRKYQKIGGIISVKDDVPVTVCPQRFLESKELLRWVGKVMLGGEHPIAIKEIPFLAKMSNDEEDEKKKAGRIDWVLVDPASLDTTMRWCALETQAVYFSGKAMASEFQQWAGTVSEKIPFPTENRRPDYRSSGPKRLAPQLQVKVPELRNWGAKTAVLVDQFFFSQMSDLRELTGPEHDRLANSDVVWFVANNRNRQLVPGRVVYSRLSESITALNATRPVGKSAFESEIRDSISNSHKRGRRVFIL
jgi:hypothetical protein